MTVSIFWKPVVNNGTCISGGNSLANALENAFNGLPVNLTYGDIGILEGIKACGHDGADDLISAIHANEKIYVYTEY